MDVLDSSPATQDPVRARETTARKAQQANLGMGAALIAQIVLGVIVQLYVTVPGSDHGAGPLTAIGRALTGGPVALAAHAGFGILLLGGVVQVLIRSFQLRRTSLTALAVVNALAVVGAGFSGAGFVSSGSNAASTAMAALTAVSLVCTLVSLSLLGRRTATAG